MRARIPWTIACLALMPAGAAAQAIGVPDTSAGPRYEMQAVENGLARLDTRTGEIAFCRVADGAISCTEASSQEASVDLSGRLDALGARLDALEAQLAARAPVRPGADGMDEALAGMQRFFRAFGDVVRDLERDLAEPSAPDETAPERT